ncbi:hypothetical protein FRB98_000345 [Tulasnella sp. 332]|nr:hypothetical protein FRB98_000345 [Tulasnella sp. 332]
MSSSVVLVTGGSGLVGQAIKYVIETEPEGSRFGKKAGETWIFATSKEGDLKNPKATEALFEKYKPTHVIHLAALVGGLFKNMKYKLTFLRDNMLINTNILECSAHVPSGSSRPKVDKLISCLSTCVFPDKVTYPLDENKIHLGEPHESNFGYAHAKRMVDVYNHAYKEEFGCNFTSAIPTNVFGPYDNLYVYLRINALALELALTRSPQRLGGFACHPRTDTEPFPPENGTPFQVAGTGKPLRQFIYSRDLAKLFIWMLRDYDDVEPLILSVGEDEEVSIKSVADAIVKAVRFDGNYSFDTSRADGQFRKPASNAKLLKLIGDFKFTPFEEALDETVAWFLQNYETARTGKVEATKKA